MEGFFQEQKEEQKRLKKGDPKADKKGHPFRHPYVPANEIPDSGSIDVEEKIDRKLLKKNIVEEPEEEAEEYNERTDYEEEAPEDIGVMVKGDTAHAGPEFFKDLKSEKGTDLIKEENINDQDQVKFRHSGRLAKKIGEAHESKSYSVRTYHGGIYSHQGKRQENLKNETDSKKERSVREKIRNIWHNVSGN